MSFSKGGSISSASEFFQKAKEYMTINSTNKIKMQALKNYTPSSQQVLIGLMVSYLHNCFKFDKSISTQEYTRQLNKILQDARTQKSNFYIETDGSIVYFSKYKVSDKKSLLIEIQNNPEGILVDDQLLKFTIPGIRDCIIDLVNSRQIIAVRSKFIDKAKDKDNNYQGYYLFPFPAEVKDCLKTIFKVPEVSFKQQKLSRDERMSIIYQTKTSDYRKQFQSKASENNAKGQGRVGEIVSSQQYGKIYNTWDQKNKQSVPNFQREVQQWFKNRKI